MPPQQKLFFTFVLAILFLCLSCDTWNTTNPIVLVPENENQPDVTSPDPINGDPQDHPDHHGDMQHADDSEDTADPDSSDAALNSEEIKRPEGWTKETHGKKATPNYDVVFNDDAVPRMDITISPSDWQAMLDDMEEDYGPFGGTGSIFSMPVNINPLGKDGDRWDVWAGGNPIYVPCNIVFQEKTWRHVGIRLKGDSSLAMTWQSGVYKLPFRLNFDKFEDEYPAIKNQRFFGFDSFGLASAFMDFSLSREKLTCDIFRAAGVPAGHAAFYRLFIDYGEGKKYFGLYTLQEIPDKPMLKTLFKDSKGNLYKPEGTGAGFEEWSEAAFDKETNEDEADFSDVHSLYDVLNSDRSDTAAFKSRLEKVFDVDGFLRYLAVNQVITNWDSYGRTPHNYFLYHDPGDDLIHWIPYDFNLSLGSLSGLPLSLELGAGEVGANWPLIRYIIDIPEYHTKYIAYVQKTIDDVFYPERMHAIYAATQNLIRPYVIGEEGEVKGYTMLYNPNNFENEWNRLNTHVENRYKRVQTFLEKHKEELAAPE